MAAAAEPAWTSLAGFQIDRVLMNDGSTVAVLGRDAHDAVEALVVVTRTPMSTAAVPALCSADVALRPVMRNDVYAQYATALPAALAGADVVVVRPATAEEVRRHTAQVQRLVQETRALYDAVTAPIIAASPPERLRWLDNIFDGTSEAERMVYRTPPAVPDAEAFVIVPSLRWDPARIDGLHCLAFVGVRGVATLRDVRSRHLPLLRRIWTEGREAVSRAYGVPVSQLRAFVHYLPSFYRLHVHIQRVEIANASAVVDRAHALPDVIDNLERWGDRYYADRTFTIAVGELDPLWTHVQPAPA